MSKKIQRKAFKKLLGPLAGWVYFRRSKQTRYSRFDGLQVTILPGVFHPVYFFSTKTLAGFLKGVELKNKRILELGCGTGTLGVWCAKQGAEAFASDINPNAVANAKINAKNNGVELSCLESDLLVSWEETSFDIILINPPYYPKKPLNHSEMAWFCGEDFEYFKRLFSQIKSRLDATRVYMVLSQDCDIDQIKALAEQHQVRFKLEREEHFWLEDNFVYSLSNIS